MQLLNKLRSLVARPPSSNQTTPDLGTVIRSSSAAILREATKDQAITWLSDQLVQLQAADELRRRSEIEHNAELEEMLAMRGAGPWRMPGAIEKRKPASIEAREGLPFTAQGAYGDTELMLNNIEWRRETNLSWLEFTRWGIQQIILIARLRCIKDPMLMRGMNVSAQYVFGRGVDITSPDEKAAEILTEWRERNKHVLGQVALSDLERSKYYDGNIFFVCFPDRANTGNVNVRTFDPTEILDILTDPDDASIPWYYHRQWIEKQIDQDAAIRDVTRDAWYPALGYDPADKPAAFNGNPIKWDSPVYHRKCGAIGKWRFGLPQCYAALGWAKSVQRFLEDCMTIRNSLAQFSLLLTTKGGQQAMQGLKQQLSTTVGPNASLWDQNPTAVAGSAVITGPGTTMQAFQTKGAGGDPGEVREYKLQVCMVYGLPESFFADMNTSNLATATSLDRPTELNFMERQEIWREDLAVLAQYQLQVSAGAPNGKLREAKNGHSNHLKIREAKRIHNGKRWVYEADPLASDVVEVMVNFPTIIEADVPTEIGAIVQAMTLGNKAGEVVGIDEREGVRRLYTAVGTEHAEELLKEQYPDTGPDKYDPLRTKDEPVDAAIDPATGLPKKPAPASVPGKEAHAEINSIKGALSRLGRAIRLYEARGDDGAGA